MKNKILKIELYVLFLLTFISTMYYFFSTYLPDNSLIISSESQDYYTFAYYISSLLAEVSYYVGPWIFLPFIFFAFLFSFILMRKERESDVLVAFFITMFFYGLTYLIAPVFLGEGLKILSDKYISPYLAFFSTLMFGIMVFYLTLRSAFFVLLKRLQFRLEKMGVILFRRMSLLSKKTSIGLVEFKKAKPSLKLSQKATTIFRNENKISKSLKKKLSKDDIEAEEVTSVTPIISPNISNVDKVIKDTKEADITEKDAEVSELKARESNIPSGQTRKIIKESKFFKSADLIDCIASNMNNTNTAGPDDTYFTSIIRAIEDKLLEFKIDAKIINILKGPVVDTFELELGSGVRVSKVTGLSDDIGLALNGAPIRIVYPMRGKSTLGIEVPRNPRDFIFLDEVLHSNAFDDSKHRLPIAMGKDAFGDVSVVDLAAMPHMLVAGATGAGKSVFINALLVSLIVKKSPRELKLILIDPKQLELALFSDLPHLMLPVITDGTSSAIALLWAVQEMERRYSILKELGVKNIEGFNKKIKNCDPKLLYKINQYYEDQEDDGYELPYIVIVIDEFADLILGKSGKEIETNVNRLAAKARAAGIHLVVATQRPSTDVVTGVIKANFPTRVAFRVTTGHDSKTILDQYGAEKLLGKGDMLYKHGVDLLRLHSSFVEENEIEGLIEKLATIPQTFNLNAIDFMENGGEDPSVDYSSNTGPNNFVSGSTDDPMYEQALEVVMESGSASASMLQRRLRVGYNRAANIIDELEKNGIVGPAQGSKPRKVIGRPE